MVVEPGHKGMGVRGVRSGLLQGRIYKFSSSVTGLTPEVPKTLDGDDTRVMD